MKRGVIFGETVVYILAFLVFTLILIFGYRSISDVGSQQEQTKLIILRTELQSDLQSIARDFGSVKIQEYEIPGNYEKICFFNPDGETPFPNQPSADDPIVTNAYTDRVNDVLLIGKDVQSLSLSGIKTSESVSCVNIENQKLKLRIEGKGNKVSIG